MSVGAGGVLVLAGWRKRFVFCFHSLILGVGWAGVGLAGVEAGAGTCWAGLARRAGPRAGLGGAGKPGGLGERWGWGGPGAGRAGLF